MNASIVDGTNDAEGARMLRRSVVVIALLFASSSKADANADSQDCACDLTPAACDAGCACDLECEVDWTVDECADPAAGCLPDAPEPDDATLDAAELASPDDETVDWPTSIADVACADGAVKDDAGHCRAGDLASDTGGCSTGGSAGLAIAGLAIGIAIIARRRALGRLLLVLAIGCTVDNTGWDDAVEAGPTGDPSFIDVYSAPLGDGDGAQLLLAHQTLADHANQPVAELSLSRAVTGHPVFRTATPNGDRLSTEAGDELLGWAHAGAGDGTAELVELQAPDGAFVYETHAESIDALLAEGYAVTNRLGFVWPPGLADTVMPDDDLLAAPAHFPELAPCHVSKHSATHSSLVLLYASPGADESERFLIGCPGEIVIGEKRETGPVGRMRKPAAQAAGGRTAFVLDRHGDKLRGLLLRNNGVERTVAYLKHKMAIGYDYIVIDEITAAADFADRTTLNRRLRALMQRMPIRTIIPYISIDLVQHPGGFEAMRARRLLLRAFKLRARGLALEVYLHTGEVMAGAAPSVYRRAADRLALSVHGLARTGGINLRAISVIGTSMHSTFAQYRYLDQPSHDLTSITRQVNALRHGSHRVRQQHGVGYYFVNQSDMAPVAHAPYSYDGLVRRLRLQALRFR